MQLSSYCKIYLVPGIPKQVRLFSTLTTAVADVSRDVLRDIEANTLSRSEIKTLTELGFLVKSKVSEQRDMLKSIDRVNRESTTLMPIVAMNLDCNLGCTYCYEGSRKGKHYMSELTAESVANFVRSSLRRNTDTIDIHFYGGEPLLSVYTIRQIAAGVKAMATKRGLLFSFVLITNGTLITPRIVRSLKPLGLRGVNITLDGPQQIHDMSRPYRSGTGSFQTIIRNIKSVSRLVKVHISGNFTKRNYRKFPALLDHLQEYGLGPKSIRSVEFNPVFRERKEFANLDFVDGCVSSNEPWLRSASVFLRGEILKRGYKTSKIEPMVCAIERNDNLVINYDGSIYRCPGLIGRERFRAGSVETGVLADRQAHAPDIWKNDRCLACPYLPLCFGGCRYMKFLREGEMCGIDCRKAYFDAVLPRMIAQDLKYTGAAHR